MVLSRRGANKMLLVPSVLLCKETRADWVQVSSDSVFMTRCQRHQCYVISIECLIAPETPLRERRGTYRLI